MNNDTLFVLFSYEILKCEFMETDFTDYLKSRSVNLKAVIKNRNSLKVSDYLNDLYSLFLSEVVYLQLLLLNDDYWLKETSYKINYWLDFFNNNSEYIKKLSETVSTLNRYEFYTYLQKQIHKHSNTNPISISIPINNPQLTKTMVTKLRKKHPYISPIFIIEEDMVAGVKVNYNQVLYNYSWKDQVISKLH